jgi:dynein heavy chain 1
MRNLDLFDQIEYQLNAYLRRVEDVLGKGWENHVEGQKLKADGDSFRMKLNTQELFEDPKVFLLTKIKT